VFAIAKQARRKGYKRFGRAKLARAGGVAHKGLKVKKTGLKEDGQRGYSRHGLAYGGMGKRKRSSPQRLNGREESETKREGGQRANASGYMVLGL